jgi:aspartate racemase
MRRIGLIGGMSWESTLEYYRYINQEVRDRLGGLHSAPLILYSFEFAPIARKQAEGDWASLDGDMYGAANALHSAGADIILICTNTMHKCAHALEDFELLHIVDAIAAGIRERGMRRVGLLGTNYTMMDDSYVGRLRECGIEVVVPDREDREEVHSIIFDRLCQGVHDPVDREKCIDIIRSMVDKGAEGVILGCTELPLLIGQEDVPVPLLDSTRLHAIAAVNAVME